MGSELLRLVWPPSGGSSGTARRSYYIRLLQLVSRMSLQAHRLTSPFS